MTLKILKNTKRFLLPIFFSLIATGCANTPTAINLLKKNDLIVIQSPTIGTNELEFTFSSIEIAEDVTNGNQTSTNMGAGIAIGGGSFLCGPGVFVCMAASGLWYGIDTVETTKEGATTVVPTDLSVYNASDVKNINNKINAYIISKKPQQNFLNFVTKNASERYQVSTSEDATKITVLLSAMGLNHQGNNTVVLVIQSIVSVNFIDEAGKPQEVKQLYQYISPPNNIQSWVNEDERYYQSRFDKAYREMAENIIMTLSY